jgi:hypothetical protein
MILDGISLEPLFGHYEDDWCARIVRGQATALRAGSGLYVRPWIGLVPGRPDFSVMVLSLGDNKPVIANIAHGGEANPVETRHSFAAGDRIGFQIFNTHKIDTDGRDPRELSFVLLAIGLIAT